MIYNLHLKKMARVRMKRCKLSQPIRKRSFRVFIKKRGQISSLQSNQKNFKRSKVNVHKPLNLYNISLQWNKKTVKGLKEIIKNTQKLQCRKSIYIVEDKSNCTDVNLNRFFGLKNNRTNLNKKKHRKARISARDFNNTYFTRNVLPSNVFAKHLLKFRRRNIKKPIRPIIFWFLRALKQFFQSGFSLSQQNSTQQKSSFKRRQQIYNQITEAQYQLEECHKVYTHLQSIKQNVRKGNNELQRTKWQAQINYLIKKTSQIIQNIENLERQIDSIADNCSDFELTNEELSTCEQSELEPDEKQIGLIPSRISDFELANEELSLFEQHERELDEEQNCLFSGRISDFELANEELSLFGYHELEPDEEQIISILSNCTDFELTNQKLSLTPCEQYELKQDEKQIEFISSNCSNFEPTNEEPSTCQQPELEPE